MNNKGITIIPLIITIVLMVIISGIALNISLGNNGIIKKSEKAVNIYEQAEKEEKKHYDKRFYDMSSEKLSSVVSIGDYVNYNEGTGYTYIADGEKTGTKEAINSEDKERNFWLFF